MRRIRAKSPPRKQIDTAKARTAASERMARYRARVREESIVAPVDTPNYVTAMLIALHWLPASKSENRRSVGEAISAMLKDAAAAYREKV